MKLDGRRESNNVEDRRGMSGGAKAGIGGIGGIIVIALMTFLGGGDFGDVVNNVMEESMGTETTVDANYTPTAEEEELASFSKKILAGTEDVWTEIFKENGMEYQPPKLVLFSNRVSSGCGNATSQTGPFYCSGDQTVYIDLSFFSTMQEELGGGGDFAYAYVIAHEVGHHVQYLLGDLKDSNEYYPNETENQTSVRTELQADFYAGIWAHYDNEKFSSLEDGDIEEGLDIASKIGDDYLQKKAQGYEVPESFNHGRSEWRARWLKKGIKTGDLSLAQELFKVPYNKF